MCRSYISATLTTHSVRCCRIKSVKGPMYKVLLHNDNMNKREYVVKVLLKVVEGMTVDDAVNVMHEAHVQARPPALCCCAHGLCACQCAVAQACAAERAMLSALTCKCMWQMHVVRARLSMRRRRVVTYSMRALLRAFQEGVTRACCMRVRVQGVEACMHVCRGLRW
jgi:hypothetical protein